MTKKKGITQSQNVEGRRGFGSFLARLASGPFPTLPEAVSPGEEEDADMFGAWRRASLPKKVAALEKEIAAMKRANNPARKRPLWYFVREAKKHCPSKVSDHGFIARYVDSLLAKKGKELCQVCPVSWNKMVNNLPRLLDDARKCKELKGPIKVFISKVPVS